MPDEPLAPGVVAMMVLRLPDHLPCLPNEEMGRHEADDPARAGPRTQKRPGACTPDRLLVV